MANELKEIYESELWAEIELNFQALDDFIEDDDVRDFYKRLIWQMVTDKSNSKSGN